MCVSNLEEYFDDDKFKEKDMSEEEEGNFNAQLYALYFAEFKTLRWGKHKIFDRDRIRV